MTQDNAAPVDDDTLIAEIPKNTREVIRITLSTYKQSNLIHLRVWTRGTERSLPTKSGFACQVGTIDQLIDALQKAKAEAQRIGWLNGGGT